MFKVYVSPSSQVANTYSAGNTNEAVQCRKIALHLVDALTRCGIEAKTNVTAGITMYDRVKESNEFGADLHICIHTNAFNKKMQGTRLFCSSLAGSGGLVCKTISKYLYPLVPGESDGIQTATFYEIKATNAPCAYVEAAFHDNEEQSKWIIENVYNIAEAICEGVCDHYKLDYISNDCTLPEKENTAESPAKDVNKSYHVQVGAFKNKMYADALAVELRENGYSAFVTYY